MFLDSVLEPKGSFQDLDLNRGDSKKSKQEVDIQKQEKKANILKLFKLPDNQKEELEPMNLGALGKKKKKDLY